MSLVGDKNTCAYRGDDDGCTDSDAPVRYRRVPTEAPELADDGNKVEELLNPNQVQLDPETRWEWRKLCSGNYALFDILWLR